MKNEIIKILASIFIILLMISIILLIAFYTIKYGTMYIHISELCFGGIIGLSFGIIINWIWKEDKK